MAAFDHHILVCTQEKPDGVPACGAAGAAVLEAMRARVGAAGRMTRTLVTGCGCLGLCQRGPNVLVHPQGRWYTGARPQDAEAIVQAELVEGRALEGRGEPDEATIRADVDEHRSKVRAMLQGRAKAGVLPEEITSLAGGYRGARAFLTALELDVFTAVGQRSTAQQVATRIGADERATTALLRVLVSLGLLDQHADTFSNAEVARTFLCEGGPHDARVALMHTAHLWHRWSELTECVKTGTPASKAARTADHLETFIAAMHRNAAMRAPLVVRAIDLTDVREVLDIGGGSAAYSIALTEAKADLCATVFDLPAVLPIARRYVEQAGKSGCIKFAEGSFHADDFGKGFDLALLFAICHMNSPEENEALLRRVAGALRVGGRVVIQDFVLDAQGKGHATATLFALNMLVNTKGGNSYTSEEYGGWLQSAGFVDVRVVPIPGPTSLIIATRA